MLVLNIDALWHLGTVVRVSGVCMAACITLGVAAALGQKAVTAAVAFVFSLYAGIAFISTAAWTTDTHDHAFPTAIGCVTALYITACLVTYGGKRYQKRHIRR